MNFSDWLIDKGYAEQQLTDSQLDLLYEIYFNETGGEDDGSLF